MSTRVEWERVFKRGGVYQSGGWFIFDTKSVEVDWWDYEDPPKGHQRWVVYVGGEYIASGKNLKWAKLMADHYEQEGY
tara:strand:- start:39 stop:272 length:234 start_codon:yes stop_codon:yes gene_type:complete